LGVCYFSPSFSCFSYEQFLVFELLSFCCGLMYIRATQFWQVPL
jgi:hypothetical protein